MEWCKNSLLPRLFNCDGPSALPQDPTEYSLLATIARDFDPYFSLWTTASDWQTWHRSWLNDPFETLDVAAMEQGMRPLSLSYPWACHGLNF